MTSIVSSEGSLKNADQIAEKIVALQAALQQSLPGYESLLFTIHQEIKKDPDIAHILSEEQVGIIVAGLSKKKGIIISEEKARSPAAKASLKKTTVDDL